MYYGTLTRVSDQSWMHVVLYIYIEGFIYTLFVQFLTISTCNYVYLIFRSSTSIAFGPNLEHYTEDTTDEFMDI